MPLFCFIIFREPQGTRASQTAETGKTVLYEAFYSNRIFCANGKRARLQLLKGSKSATPLFLFICESLAIIFNSEHVEMNEITVKLSTKDNETYLQEHNLQ